VSAVITFIPSFARTVKLLCGHNLLADGLQIRLAFRRLNQPKVSTCPEHIPGEHLERSKRKADFGRAAAEPVKRACFDSLAKRTVQVNHL
jgi:hypothetical protein